MTADGRDEAALGQSRPTQRVRYWPTIDVPRLPDGSVDIRAYCRLLDDLMNGAVA